MRLEATRTRLGDTVTMIEDALHGTGIDLPSGTDMSLPPAETTAHTWVQMAKGSTWVDLDPTMAGSQPGAVLTQPTETLPELPDDLRNKIEFGVLVETATGGQLATNEVLTYDGYADELAETPVTFAQGKPSGFKSIGVTLGDLFGGVGSTIDRALFVGDQAHVADHGVAFPAGSGSDPFSTASVRCPRGARRRRGDRRVAGGARDPAGRPAGGRATHGVRSATRRPACGGTVDPERDRADRARR